MKVKVEANEKFKWIELVEDATRFFLRELRKTYPYSTRGIHVSVLIGKIEENYSAYIDSSVETKEFSIVIDHKMNIVAIIRCLAHECTHIAQEMEGLPRADGGKAYYFRQSEQEAYAMERRLLERFLKMKTGWTNWYVDLDYIKL